MTGEVQVKFTGDDGRTRTWDFSGLPLPGWHRPLAEALSARIGPAGGLRTRESANSAWIVGARLLRYLSGLHSAPAAPGSLTVQQLRRYRQHRSMTLSAANTQAEMAELRRLLRRLPEGSRLRGGVSDVLSTRAVHTRRAALPGYSEGEFTRLVAAARADATAIQHRIERGEHLLARWRDSPDEIEGDDRGLAMALASIADTATVPTTLDGQPLTPAQRTDLAGHLFLTWADLSPLLVLVVAVSGRNVETIKELPTEHRRLGDRAIEARVVKRRRGARGWFDTVTWDIGPRHRALHTPGGLYLLLHRLMSRARALSGHCQFWVIWRPAVRRTARQTASEFQAPFAARLSSAPSPTAWAARRGLCADPAPGRQPRALAVDLRRVRTSVEVRRTRAVGGHLPTAARSNTVPVLFTNYLRGDPSTLEWAEQVTADGLGAAEAAALAGYRRRQGDTGEHLAVVSEVPAEASAGPWSACRDLQKRPSTGRTCRTPSLLDCFQCGNCLITDTHLPALLTLNHALTDRRGQLAEDDWWARYGPAWVAIQHDILPKFTPAQLQHAEAHSDGPVPLDLAEAPWEIP